jgi:hypothetical protein
MTAGSHLWASGLQFLTGTQTNANTGTTSWTQLLAGSPTTPYNVYTGHWRIGLLSAVPAAYYGQTSTAMYYAASGNTEITNSGGAAYSALGKQIDGTANTIAYGSTDSPVGSHVEFCSTGSTQAGGISSWTTASFTANYAEVFASTGTNSTSPVLGQYDFGGAYTVTSGTFSVTFGTDSGVSNSVFNLAVQ